MAKSNTKPQFDPGIGKLPPQAIEVEEMVLGALLSEGNSIIDIVDTVTPETFYKETHQRVYSAILSLFNESTPIDLGTVMARLRKTDELELIGGMQALMKLSTKANLASNIEYHARILSELRIKRQLIQICAEIQNEAYNDSSDAFILLDQVETQVFQISQNNTKKSFTSIEEGINESLFEMDNRKNQGEEMTGVPSGFPDLDKVTAGFQRGELTIMAARPGMGKSSIITSIMRNSAVDFDKPVALFSLEMSTMQVVNRMISAEAEIEAEKIKRGKLSPAEWEKLHKRIGRLSVSKIFIDDSHSMSLLELRAKCRRLKSQHDIQMIVIDYLQLMNNSTNGKQSGTREQEIAAISRGLKNLAKELDIPVIALSQLSRSIDNRGGDKRPVLSDLRESGSIEQDADAVMFLYRPEYYGITEDEAGNSLFGIGEVIIAKNRSGTLSTISLRFVGKYTKFEPIEAKASAPELQFSPTVNLDTPVVSFQPTKPNTTFDYSTVNDEPF